MLGTRFHPAPKQDQRNDHDRRIVIGFGSTDREKGSENTVKIGRRCAHGNERIHVGVTMAESVERTSIKLPAAKKLYRGGQNKQKNILQFDIK